MQIRKKREEVVRGDDGETFPYFFRHTGEKRKKNCGEKYLLSLPFFKGGEEKFLFVRVSNYSFSFFPPPFSFLFEMREKSKL